MKIYGFNVIYFKLDIGSLNLRIQFFGIIIISVLASIILLFKSIT
jgi:hypothetical protein